MVVDRPLLGVAGSWGSAEIELAHRFDDLHQLVYRRGGIRSSNAAVEEVAKLILIRLWSLRTGARQPVTVEDCRAAFAAALTEPSLAARDAVGHTHPIWPLDEPFRLADPAVLDAATAIVEDTIRLGSASVADPLGTAFDALLAGRYDHTGGLGTYLTPSGVARMMAEIGLALVKATPVEGAPGFGDPFCGTGRFLVAALASLPHDHPLRTAGPFGADQSTAAVAKARINMLLYGVPRPLVWTVRDSVTDAGVAALLGRVPLILTNPPFGDGQYDDPEGVASTVEALPGLASRRRIDPSLACLVRSLRLLAPGGVLGIVLPDGIIGSDAFGELVFGSSGSASLAASVALAASVSLPTSTFALSGTVAKTTAVFLRRDAPVSRVALARVEHVGYLRQAGRAAPDPQGDELPAVPGLIAAGLARSMDHPPAPNPEGRGPSHGEERSAGSLATSPIIASLEPLVAVAPAGFVRGLDPARLDPIAMSARQRLVAAGGVELRSRLSVVPTVRAKTITRPFVSVLHIDDLGGVDWPAAHAHSPTTTGLLAPPGSLIVSLLNPSRLRAAVIPSEGEPVQVSAEFGVFVASCDPHAVLGLLYSPDVRAQLRPLGSGTSSSRRRISAADVLALIVPALSEERLAVLGAEVRTASALVTTGRHRLTQLFASP